MTNVTWKILEGNWALPCFAQYGFETRAFIYNPLVYQSQKKIHHFPFRRWRIWGVSSQDWMPRSCWVVKDSRVRQTHPTEPGSGVGLPLKPMGTSGSENGGNRVLTPGYPSMATWNIRTVMTNHGIWGPYFQTTHMVNIWGTYGKEMEKLSRKTPVANGFWTPLQRGNPFQTFGKAHCQAVSASLNLHRCSSQILTPKGVGGFNPSQLRKIRIIKNNPKW